MNISTELTDLIRSTPWIDTHEHLVEEHARLTDSPYSYVDMQGVPEYIAPGWPSLFSHLTADDLVTAGLEPQTAWSFRTGELDAVEEVWEAVSDYIEAARNTGYMRSVDLSTERLFGLRLSGETYEEIDHRCRELCRPGYYAHVLREVANIERCQVNSLEYDPFCETHTPDLLDQDLFITPISMGRHVRAEAISGIEVGTLGDYLQVLEWCFERFAPHAVATKCLHAYYCPVAIETIDAPPRKAFARLRRGDDDARDRRDVHSFLLRRCVQLATTYGLPVKIHLGSLAHNHDPHLSSVFGAVADITPLIQQFPRTQFVLFHMAWPQQEQLIALAKHQPNVVVELSWAWVVAHRSTVEFVERFLTTVPATKLLCFGGDSTTVENVVGHAELARRGLLAALSRLLESDWFTLDDAIALVPALMRGNAERIFHARMPTASGPS